MPRVMDARGKADVVRGSHSAQHLRLAARRG
jgi:hypothetical protein